MGLGLTRCSWLSAGPRAHSKSPMSHAYIGDQALKAFAAGCRCARLALIVVDDDNRIVAPVQGDGATAQRVLTFRALDVLETSRMDHCRMYRYALRSRW